MRLCHPTVTTRVAPGLLAAVMIATGFLASPASAVAADTGPVAMTNGFYVDPNSSPLTWANANPGDGRAATIKSAIGNTPMARWFTSASGDIGTATGSYVGAAASSGQLPILVAYNIPNRDICGGQSGGGAGSDDAYNTWIAAFASGIGTRPAIVILEPDTLGDESCMTQAQIDERNGLLNNAITQFTNYAPNTWVYLDAGNPGWLPAATMAAHLDQAGLARAHGFSLNVSNFYTTAENVTYGNSINSTLNGQGYTRPFVIDTSRNGNGSDGTWCNPAARKIGTPTQLGGGAEMLLWIKVVGESDGDCGVGAGSAAGQFLPQVAYNLVFGY